MVRYRKKFKNIDFGLKNVPLILFWAQQELFLKKGTHHFVLCLLNPNTKKKVIQKKRCYKGTGGQSLIHRASSGRACGPINRFYERSLCTIYDENKS